MRDRPEKDYANNWQFHVYNSKAIMAGENPGGTYSNWDSYYERWRTDEMSDHLPVWIEFKTDYSNA